jgi:pSer/pThr/pTyr-binding forkhead associated (FHA) protein
VCEPGRTALLIVAAGRLEIGRGGSGLLLADPQISRRHLVVESGGDGVVVRDAGSTNGTTVDGVRVRLPVLLASGQVLRFGRCTLELVAWPPPARDVRGRDRGAPS